MRPSLPYLIFSLLTTLPLALSAPADTPATTTLHSVTPTLSSAFPFRTPYDSPYQGAGCRGGDESDEPWKIAPLHSEPSQILTEFVPAPTGPDGKDFQ
ncbi:hypothetical protein VE00_09440 [Pseudogymnoascus sp. WSF 3629]|nr:hypothetical protein VE00_09440 [Pseudogymnoascus sp. WSF 3629]